MHLHWSLPAFSPGLLSFFLPPPSQLASFCGRALSLRSSRRTSSATNRRPAALLTPLAREELKSVGVDRIPRSVQVFRERGTAIAYYERKSPLLMKDAIAAEKILGKAGENSRRRVVALWGVKRVCTKAVKWLQGRGVETVWTSLEERGKGGREEALRWLEGVIDKPENKTNVRNDDGRGPAQERDGRRRVRCRGHEGERAMFDITAEFGPTGDQPRAIESLAEGIGKGQRFQTLLGATGTGKTFVMANVISRAQMPTLVIAPNKTLAAQLCNELRGYLGKSAVEYFVSYYSYYQPEAYIAATDTHIDKVSTINPEIDRLRHSATRALFSRKDVVIVASVSCLYGLGLPAEYLDAAMHLRVGASFPRLRKSLIDLCYTRNDTDPGRGQFRRVGSTFDIGPPWETEYILYRVEMDADVVAALTKVDLVTEKSEKIENVTIFPAKHFLMEKDRVLAAIQNIEGETEEQSVGFEKEGKFLEAQRLRDRVNADMEMLKRVGYCAGIENYSRHLSGRAPGTPPACLLDYFPGDGSWLCIIDESHVTVPQIAGMYNGDRMRKLHLVEHGFRLPSAVDNRPLTSDEFWSKVRHCMFVSATPGSFELYNSGDVSQKDYAPASVDFADSNAADCHHVSDGSRNIVEMVVRPTGVLDPLVEVLPTKDQISDLYRRLCKTVARGERALVTTLTKRFAEDLASHLETQVPNPDILPRKLNVTYLHSEIDAVDRLEVLASMKAPDSNTATDVIVGVNLLREGIDLPMVSLVAVMDADKEGFLRSETALIQTIGRAARHINGRVLMYAERITGGMKRALEETKRRRRIQTEYNRKHGQVPKPIVRSVSSEGLLEQIKRTRNGEFATKKLEYTRPREDRVMDVAEIDRMDVSTLRRRMREAADRLDFELAARLRDRIKVLEGL